MTAPITLTVPGGPISHVGTGPIASAEATASGTTVTFPVTTASHAGDALLVSVMLTSTTAGTFTATDSKGNTYHYSSGSDVFDSGKHRTLVLAAYNTTALAVGDSITLKYPAASKYNAEVDEFSGIGALDQQTTAFGAAGGTSFTTPAATTTASNELLFTAVGTNSGPRRAADCVLHGRHGCGRHRVAVHREPPRPTHRLNHHVIDVRNRPYPAETGCLRPCREPAGRVEALHDVGHHAALGADRDGQSPSRSVVGHPLSQEAQEFKVHRRQLHTGELRAAQLCAPVMRARGGALSAQYVPRGL